MEEVKVLYLVGKGRSGGTLVNNLLGQIDGFVAVGELSRLWTWGLQEGALCGCGRVLRECPFWQEVLAKALGGQPDYRDLQAMVDIQRRVLSWAAIPRILVQPEARAPRWKTLRRYVDLSSRIYRAIAQTASARVIVESTKSPAAPTALGLVPGIDSYVLHLIRDPRAVIYAWKKRDKRWVDRPESPNIRFGPLYSMLSWWGRNFLAEVAGSRRGTQRYCRYRYEDFVARPQQTLRAICGWLGESEVDLSFVSGTTVALRPTHTAGGNPNRLRSGEVHIRMDDEWLTRQPRKDRIIGTVLSMPFLQRYGYPLIPPRN